MIWYIVGGALLYAAIAIPLIVTVGRAIAEAERRTARADKRMWQELEDAAP